MRNLLILAALLVPFGVQAAEDKKPTLAEIVAATPQPVYAVTQGREVAFRAEPDSKKQVLGYFPAHQVVLAVRPQKEWMMVHYQGVSGWVLKEELITVFTLDPKSKLPL